MYSNLTKVMKEKNISPPMLAKILDLDDKSIRNKLSGITEFKLSEIRQIMNLFPEYNMEWLFAVEEEAV